jgi:hypothetical protein
MVSFDISRPERITVLNELETDGFDAYLHPFDDDHLLGVGKQGGNVRLSLYSIPSRKRGRISEVNTIVLDGVSHAEALDDPHALFHNPAHNIFGIFASRADVFGDETQGAFVFGVEGGRLVRRAFLTNYMLRQRGSDKYGRFDLTRALVFDGFIYGISDGFITSFSLTDFEFFDILDTRLDKEDYVDLIYRFSDTEYYIKTYAHGIPFVPPLLDGQILQNGKTFLHWSLRCGTPFVEGTVLTRDFALFAVYG